MILVRRRGSRVLRSAYRRNDGKGFWNCIPWRISRDASVLLFAAGHAQTTRAIYNTAVSARAQSRQERCRKHCAACGTTASAAVYATPGSFIADVIGNNMRCRLSLGLYAARAMSKDSARSGDFGIPGGFLTIRYDSTQLILVGPP